MKQAPANWYKTLKAWFKEINFTQSASDPRLFIHKDKDFFIFFHVDNLVVVGKVEAFETLFINRFPISTAHKPDTLLGMDVCKEEELIALLQAKLIEKGVLLLGLQDCKPFNMPLYIGVQLGPATEAKLAEFNKLNLNCRTYTGLLNYLSCRTQLDLAPAVSILFSFNNAPRINHWQQVIHCRKYVAHTCHLRLMLQPNPADQSASIQHYTDVT